MRRKRKVNGRQWSGWLAPSHLSSILLAGESCSANFQGAIVHSPVLEHLEWAAHDSAPHSTSFLLGKQRRVSGWVGSTMTSVLVPKINAPQTTKCGQSLRSYCKHSPGLPISASRVPWGRHRLASSWGILSSSHSRWTCIIDPSCPRKLGGGVGGGTLFLEKASQGLRMQARDTNAVW